MFFFNENTNLKSHENDSKGVFNNFFQKHFVYFNPKADFKKKFSIIYNLSNYHH